MVAGEVLHLRQHQRREEHRCCLQPAAARRKRHERDEPRHVLRGEHLAEHRPGGHCGRPRGDESRVRIRAAPVPDRDERDEGKGEERAEACDHVRHGAAEVDRARLAGDPVDVVDAELRAGEQDRGAERLDLEMTLDLRLDAEAHPAGSDQEERQEEDAAGDEEGEGRSSRSAKAPPRQRQRDNAVDLDRRVGAEQRSGRDGARAQERDERERGQERRQRVVAVEEDRAHQDGREHKRAETPRREPEALHDPRRADDAAEATGGHQELEHEHVVRVPDRRRRGEDGHRAGWVLVVEVVVRNAAVVDKRSPVPRVRLRVAGEGMAEEPAERQRTREQEESAGDERRPSHRENRTRSSTQIARNPSRQVMFLPSANVRP